jgi:hypothetical protein
MAAGAITHRSRVLDLDLLSGLAQHPEALDQLAELVGHGPTLGQVAALLGYLTTLPKFPELTPLDLAVELHRIVPLEEAARLSSMSVDTIKRRHRDKFIALSERRQGLRLKDVLFL